ncbi:MAG: nitrile hydratase subunit beta [Bradyrhizobiaceae bacterium]|nr:nitrile hydratase subunit beta [Bradyrhizobiaceae bacterium]
MSAAEHIHRFRVGNSVQVHHANPAGNPRTPAYIRGKRGIVTTLHGSIPNRLDHRGVYPPLYSVLFLIGEVFGSGSHDTLLVDLHEDWLAPAEDDAPAPQTPV